MTCGPSAELQCLQLCLEMNCWSCINLSGFVTLQVTSLSVTVSVAKSIGTLIISPFSSAGQQQQCQCRNSLMSQCSSLSAGLSGRIKTWEQQKRLFHPSGKGQKVR